MSRTDVLIAGAGPTGLVLALWLTKQGRKVRIVDKAAAPVTTSRALAVQARTLELYRQLDLERPVLEAGHPVPGANMWARGEKRGRIDFSSIGAGLTPYGLFIFPQDEHERLLVQKLESMGVQVERATEFVHFSDSGTEVTATLATSRGEQQCVASYLAGCDGARSKVRELMGAGFPGGTYQRVFYVADVEATGPALDGELHIDMDDADFLVVFPLKGQGRARLIGTVKDEQAEHAESLRFEDVQGRAIEHMKVQVGRLNWFSAYRIHHRVTDHFRKGRAFLLGDAAHIHSPVGGQGMNTGIGDAINLAWKLTAVLQGHATDALLESYEAERHAFAETLVATTDRAFTFVTAESRVADFVRVHIAPRVLPQLFKIDAARRFIFSTVAQLALSYHEGPIADGHAGKVHGGDRLPWAPVPGADNFATLAQIVWQVHVYGSASSQLRDWCAAHGVPLHTFKWDPLYESAGLARDALYLLRPDSYVGFADAGQDIQALERYLALHGLALRVESTACSAGPG